MKSVYLSIWLSFAAMVSFAQVSGSLPPIKKVAPSKSEAISQKPSNEKDGATFQKYKLQDCIDCPEMVVIPAGTFFMGSKTDPFASNLASADEQPQHLVSIKSFLMGKYEVTQEQWYAVMGTMPSNFKGRTLPVEQVSWDDAQVFVKKLSDKTGKNYRLPTEAEWEYAARGRSQTSYAFGENENQLERFAWFLNNSYGQTHPIGEKTPNTFGLYDVLGNVFEWTQDCWNPNYDDAPTDGSAWTSGYSADCDKRVSRGGAWSYHSQHFRSAYRDWNYAADSHSFLGFRVARNN